MTSRHPIPHYQFATLLQLFSQVSKTLKLYEFIFFFIGCYCQNEICFFPINLNVQSTGFLDIYMGNFQNPPMIRNQITLINLNFNLSGSLNFSQNYSIPSGSYLPGAIYNQSLVQDSFQRAAETNYTIYFNIMDTILLNGMIVLTFPAENSLTFITNVYWKSYNDSVETNVSFSSSSQTLTLASLFLTNSLTPNSSGILSIRICSIQNPSTIINTTSIMIQTTDNQGDLIDEV